MIRALSLAVCLVLALQVFALPTDCPECLTASELAAEAPDDFTDSGVGCVDDCLEPFTSPETVPDEYTLEDR
jgi:hypothetical protein